jgi:hypothetical protein
MSTDRVPLPAMSPKGWRRSGSHPPCDRLRRVHVQCGIINYKDLILHRKPESFVKSKTHKLFVCHNNRFGSGILLLTTRRQVWFLTLVLISLVLLSDFIEKIFRGCSGTKTCYQVIKVVSLDVALARRLFFPILCNSMLRFVLANHGICKPFFRSN